MATTQKKIGTKKAPLVSIVVPTFNAGKFIDDTVNSVLEQSYENWELIIVDDCSSDDTLEILKRFESDKIKVVSLEKNSGAAKARNRGISIASGRYICFLDADDLWKSSKLKKQVEFMKEKDCAFSFTSYVFADADGKPNGKVVKVPATINYKQALRNTTIWSSTVMFDMEKLSKDDVYMPDVRRGQDTATWWKVLKKVDKACGLFDITAIYRRSNKTLSSNKLTALKRTWNLYRNVEHLNIIRILHCFSWYCFNAVRRRI